MIKRIVGIAVTIVMALLMAGAARPADLSQTVILVASHHLDGSPFEQTVVVAASLPDGGHIGFIVNRPTRVRLETLFPDQALARNVEEPVYLGGPVLTDGVFVLMRSAPDDTEISIPLTPGVVAVLDGTTIDRVIESTPNAARYFVGLMVWGADELEQQIAGGLWEVRPADADSVLPATVPDLWTSLRGPLANTDRSSPG